VSSGVIGSGGLGLHPLVIRAVMVLCSGCMSLTWSPFSPCISMGLSPVCVEMSSFNDRGFRAAEISMFAFSCVGGCIAFSSTV
jgi:hypothetical protein